MTEEQRRSFAYGNTNIDNPNVTREMVDAAADNMTELPALEAVRKADAEYQATMRASKPATEKETAMTNHTPGPWHIEAGGGHMKPRIVGADIVQTHGTLYAPGGSYSEGVCQFEADINLPGPRANANLIAAAPDLLKALQRIAGIGEYEDGDDTSYLACADPPFCAKGEPWEHYQECPVRIAWDAVTAIANVEPGWLEQKRQEWFSRMAEEEGKDG